jgi:hypothetical protein
MTYTELYAPHTVIVKGADGTGFDWTDERGTSEEGKEPRQRARAADWTEERRSEERASERRGKLGGYSAPGGAK